MYGLPTVARGKSTADLAAEIAFSLPLIPIFKTTDPSIKSHLCCLFEKEFGCATYGRNSDINIEQEFVFSSANPQASDIFCYICGIASMRTI